MDIISLYYFRELSKDLSMTKTANRLFISQQTLSYHIQILEKEYGTNFFNRTPKMTLTDAGRQLLTTAHSILEEEGNFRNIVNDITKNESGLLRIGAGSQRGLYFLPNVLTDFGKRYPKVKLQLTTNISVHLQEQVLNDDLDLAITNIAEKHPLLTYEFAHYYPIYICIADKLLKHYYGKEAAKIKNTSKNGINIASIQQLPFINMGINNGIDIIMSKAFEEIGVTPNIYLTSRHSHLNAQLCARGLAACFMNHFTLLNELQSLSKGINIFPLLLDGKPTRQMLNIIRHKKNYLPMYTKYFIKLLKADFQKISDETICRVVK